MYTQRVAWLASPVTPTCLAKSWLIESMQGAIYKKNLKKKKLCDRVHGVQQGSKRAVLPQPPAREVEAARLLLSRAPDLNLAIA